MWWLLLAGVAAYAYEKSRVPAAVNSSVLTPVKFTSSAGVQLAIPSDQARGSAATIQGIAAVSGCTAIPVLLIQYFQTTFNQYLQGVFLSDPSAAGGMQLLRTDGVLDDATAAWISMVNQQFNGLAVGNFPCAGVPAGTG